MNYWHALCGRGASWVKRLRRQDNENSDLVSQTEAAGGGEGASRRKKSRKRRRKRNHEKLKQASLDDSMSADCSENNSTQTAPGITGTQQSPGRQTDQAGTADVRGGEESQYDVLSDAEMEARIDEEVELLERRLKVPWEDRTQEIFGEVSRNQDSSPSTSGREQQQQQEHDSSLFSVPAFDSDQEGAARSADSRSHFAAQEVTGQTLASSSSSGAEAAHDVRQSATDSQACYNLGLHICFVLFSVCVYFIFRLWSN